MSHPPRPGRSLLSALLALMAVALGPMVTPASAAVVGLDVTTVAIQPLEGVQFSGTVADFPDPGVGPYSILIDWGDGQTSAGSTSGSCSGAACTVLANGVHLYRHVGT